jgi:class 3 adenylate cyclase
MSIVGQLGAGEQRLWRLVAERCEDSADLAVIDKKIWDLFGERWAIMFTDLSGFSRGVESFGIIHFLQVIYEHNVLVAPIIDEHQGFLLKVEGDSLMALFRRPESALRCAIEMQHACQRINKRRTAEEAILLCVGLGYGDVLRVGEHEVFGAEVNAASKLGEDTADSNEILVTGAIAEACGDAEGISFAPMDISIPGTSSVFRVGY